MSLQISIRKSISKQSIITITRSDNSTTWAKLHVGMETHDIAHFAVEKTLGFKHAFYGIIDSGYAISDFALPKDQRPDVVKPENLHPEALITEHLVNLLEVELLNSGKNANFIICAKTILSENELPFPENLNDTTLSEMRHIYKTNVDQWRALKDDESLVLQLSF